MRYHQDVFQRRLAVIVLAIGLLSSSAFDRCAFGCEHTPETSSLSAVPSCHHAAADSLPGLQSNTVCGHDHDVTPAELGAITHADTHGQTLPVAAFVSALVDVRVARVAHSRPRPPLLDNGPSLRPLRI